MILYVRHSGILLVFPSILLLAIIINNCYFTCGMKTRVGTDIDAESLSRLFIYLGFHTNRYDNLKGKDMARHLRVGSCDSSNHSCYIKFSMLIHKDVAKLDHSKFDCLVVAILTHGIYGKLYSTDGDLFSIEEIIS